MDHRARIKADPRWKHHREHGHVIVKLTSKQRGFDDILKKYGAKIHTHLHQIGHMVLDLDDDKIFDLSHDLLEAGLIEDAEPNNTGHGGFVPNDTGFGNQWYIQDVSLHLAWDITQGSTGVTIGIVDSGCYVHNDLTNGVTGWNFLTGTNVTTDSGASTGHGTATTGVAAATANNGNGIAGSSFGCSFMPIEVLNSSGSASTANTANGVIFAADNGCRVINVSLLFGSFSTTFANAIAYAWSKNCIIVACAGNDGSSSTTWYPAAYPHVLAVTATTSTGGMATFANTNTSYVNVAAPGTPIFTTTGSSNGYNYWEGTSFSSPIVAGICALMVSIQPGITNATAHDYIINSADAISGQPFGKVNALKAIQLANKAIAEAVTPTTSVSGTLHARRPLIENITPTSLVVWHNQLVGSMNPTTSVTGSLAKSANIHSGLAAWAQNTAYTSGNRISNGGNAYQCITSGTSQNTVGAGPTGTTSNITDGTAHWKFLSKIDFTTAQAWLSSLPNPLTNNVIGLFWNDAVLVEAPFFYPSPSSYSVTFTVANGEGFRSQVSTPLALDTSKGVTFQFAWDFEGDINWIIDGIQLQHNSGGACFSTGNGSFTMRNCIYDGVGGSSFAQFDLLNTVVNVDNCVIVDRGTNTGTPLLMFSGNMYAVNNSVIATATTVNNFCDSNARLLRNNIIVGYDNPIAA